MLLDRNSIDLVLVPSGLIILFGYHLFLLYRILRLPHTTVIGYENHNKRAWVKRMMEGTTGEKALAKDVIADNISAANCLATLSIALSSLIGTWVGSSSKLFLSGMMYGDNSPTTTSVKYITLIICFLIAFTSFIQSSRYYVHANFLLTTLDSQFPVGYVETAVIRGGNFWSMGLRALYFATTLLLWMFGPIPMFACSASMAVILHILDSNSTPLHQYQYSPNKGMQDTVDRPRRILLN